jgi:hypothetical protein
VAISTELLERIMNFLCGTERDSSFTILPGELYDDSIPEPPDVSTDSIVFFKVAPTSEVPARDPAFDRMQRPKMQMSHKSSVPSSRMKNQSANNGPELSPNLIQTPSPRPEEMSKSLDQNEKEMKECNNPNQRDVSKLKDRMKRFQKSKNLKVLAEL